MKVFHTSNAQEIDSFDFSKIGSLGGVQVGEGVYFSHSLSQCEVWAHRIGTCNFFEIEIAANLIAAKDFYSSLPGFIAWVEATQMRDAEGYIKEEILSEFPHVEDVISVLKSRFLRETTDFDGIDDQEGDNIVIWSQAAIRNIKAL